MIEKSHIDSFSSKFSVDLGDFFTQCDDFFENSHPKIVSFFQGKASDVNITIINKLNELIALSVKINEKMLIKNHLFNKLDEYLIFDLFNDVKTELLAATKLNKFLRSTRLNPQYTNTFQFIESLKQETIESLVSRVLFSSDSENEWIDIATQNQLKEINYTPSGGLRLNLQITINTRNQNITSIIDVINSNSILGIDLISTLSFKNDDLCCLSYEDTFKQSVYILSNLSKGDVPEFSLMGKSSFIGDNTRVFSYSALIRELTATFSTDDSIMSFNVDGIKQQDNDFFISFTCESKKDLLSQRLVKIN